VRTCIFCGKPAKSREHAWPDWLRKFMLHKRTGRTEAKFGHHNPIIRSWEGGEIRVRNVCKNCNEGWMCKLENKTKPIIIGLATDFLRGINRSQVTILARWCAKTAMVFDCLGNETPRYSTGERFYHPSTCQHVKDHSTPPHGTAIWLGRFAPSGWMWTKAHGTSAAIPGGRYESYCATFAFGHLVIQVLSVRLHESEDSLTGWAFNLKGRGNDEIINLWPLDPHSRFISWPPFSSFADEVSLEDFATRLKTLES
jgi:hypothetical protein